MEESLLAGSFWLCILSNLDKVYFILDWRHNQWGNCLMCKQDDPSLDAEHWHKKLGMAMYPCYLSTERHKGEFQRLDS